MEGKDCCNKISSDSDECETTRVNVNGEEKSDDVEDRDRDMDTSTQMPMMNIPYSMSNVELHRGGGWMNTMQSQH